MIASRAMPAAAVTRTTADEPRALAALPLSIVQTSDSSLTLDSNSPATSGPHAMFASYQITNTSGASVANLTATISGFSGGITLAGGQAATQYVGTLAAGQSRTFYWFLTYPSSFGVRNVLTVTVTDGAGGTASGNGPVVTRAMISAQAGGLTSSTSIGAGAVVGQIIPLDVTFQFKGWKAGDSFNIQPAGNETFPAGCFQLVKDTIVSADANLNAVMVPGTIDRTFFQAGVSSTGSGATWNVSVRYWFRYLCSGATATPYPYSNELSGTQLKYSANYGSGGAVPPPIPPAPSPTASFTFSKSVAAAQLPNGGTATYTIAVRNISTFDVTIDSIRDVLPAGSTYAGIAAGSGVTAANSSSVPSAGATGAITWRGTPGTSYAIAAGATLTLIYTTTISATPGQYLNTASGYVATTSIGSGSATVTVGTADLSVSKAAVTTIAMGDTLKYAITLSNAGPNAAYQVIATDSLPAGVTFVRATNGGTLASGVVTWPALTSLAAGASVVDSVLVLAPASAATIVNSARESSASYHPATANNDGSATASRVTTAVVLAVGVAPKGLGTSTKRLPGTRYSQLYTVTNIAGSAGSYHLIAASTGSPNFLTVDSITGPGITTHPRPDSAYVTLGARSSAGYTVWYTVAVGDTAENVDVLRARDATVATRQDTGYVGIRRVFPGLAIVKSVGPGPIVNPGIDLTYTVKFNNKGEFDATAVVLDDVVPAGVMFKLGTVTSTVGATVAYSNNGGTTWTYTPVTAGCGAPAGYDACVNRIHWSLTAALAPSGTQSVLTWMAMVR